MKPGDILLFKAEEDLASRLIAWGTKSSYSHVAVCVSHEMNLAIESVPGGGVRGRDIREIKTAYDVFRVKDEYTYDHPKVISFLVSKLNAKYDRLGVAWLAVLKFFILLRLPIIETANRWQKDRDYFCSELCYAAFNFAGLDIVPQVGDAETTSPGDIARSQILKPISAGT